MHIGESSDSIRECCLAFQNLLNELNIRFWGSAKLKSGIVTAVLALSVGSGSVVVASQTPFFQFLEKPGPYPVGLRVFDQYDPSRRFVAPTKGPSESSLGKNARPLQTLIWYPSLPSVGGLMTVGDYVQLADKEIHFNAPAEKENHWRSLLKTFLRYPALGGAGGEARKRPLSGSYLCSERLFRFVGERRFVRVFGQLWLRCPCKPVHGGFDARHDG